MLLACNLDGVGPDLPWCMQEVEERQRAVQELRAVREEAGGALRGGAERLAAAVVSARCAMHLSPAVQMSSCAEPSPSSLQDGLQCWPSPAC
jgi:hypothetical protein